MGDCMNWEAIGAVGEIVGAAAVVATLLYLGRQVRDNSRQVKLNTTQSYASLVQDGWAPIYNTPETIRIWHQGHDHPDGLNEEELKTYYLFMDRLINNAIPLIAHFEEGVLSRTEFEHYKDHYFQMVSTPGGSKWRAEKRFHFERVLKELREA